MAFKPKPGDADSHTNLRVVYAKEGLIDKVLEQFMAAVRLNPTDSDFGKNLGNACKAKISLDGTGRGK